MYEIRGILHFTTIEKLIAAKYTLQLTLCIKTILFKVIVERFVKEKTLPLMDKTKFLVPQELTMSQFITILRFVTIFSPCLYS